jgi:metallo-beta-lactamase family protein
MKFTFLGAAQTVTGSMHGFETGGGRLLVDCGLFQGRRQESRERNRTLPPWTEKLDAVILTHAHIDHSGNLPTLVKHGYQGPIFCTPATRDLALAMLRDAGRIQESDAAYLNRKHEDDPDWEPLEPLYTERDAIRTLDHLVTYPYWHAFEPLPGVRATFHDAGHVLGSASVVLEAEGQRVLFSGDIGRNHLPILRDPEVPSRVDVLVMESTYGNREHGPIAEVQDELAALINDIVAKRGKLIIPSFALERTQEIVYALHQLVDAKKIPPVPVIVDSPLAVSLTSVFQNHPECFDAETLQFMAGSGDPFGFESLRFVDAVADSIALNTAGGPMVIISASGMCEAGRVLHHLRNGIESSSNTIAIVGFQAQHTLGRRISERRPEVKIFGVSRPLRARVEVLHGFSAHAGRSELLEYARLAGPGIGNVFLVHGEPEAQEALAGTLRSEGLNVTIPAPGDTVEV